MARAAGCQKDKDGGHNPRGCVKLGASSLKCLLQNQAFLEGISSGRAPRDRGHPLELGWVLPSLATARQSVTNWGRLSPALSEVLWTQASVETALSPVT